MTKKILSHDEEADEIVRRLKTPPKTLEEELADILAAEIAKEIDEEAIGVLSAMYKYNRKESKQ